MLRRIIKTYFRTCSTCRSCNQAGLCLYTYCAISIRAKPTFVPLRYSFAGYRPSKTVHLALSLTLSPRVVGEFQIFQREVLHCCPKAPSYTSQSKNKKTIPNYSKAPRGLFVLVQLGRVFTANAISPSKSLRQLLSRYAFRAGRNLPDKELRYRRTVQNVSS